MEQVMDVSWMTHGKDKLGKHTAKRNSPSPPLQEPSTPNSRPLQSTTPSKINGKAAPASPPSSPQPNSSLSAARPIPQSRTVGLTRNPSNEERKGSPNATPPQRRGSWFSKISQTFSTSPGNVQHPSSTIAPPQPESDDLSPLPKINPNKNAVLPHATRQSGEAPYVPAPPKSGQAGFLQVFRRLSSSNGSPTPGRNQNGLVERRILNLDKYRERPRIHELNPAKLRRVAFCVDVEIAPMPKYSDLEKVPTNTQDKTEDKTQKRKITEKGEGEALKRPKAVEEQKEENGVLKATGEILPKEPEKDGSEAESGANGQPKENGALSSEEPKSDKDVTRKKEKKKKSEAERKAKKEQKLREAQEKGAIPMEIHLDSDSSTEEASAPKTSRPQITPTTNPGRIYRRCCQLRETDILTKITSQLPKSTDGSPEGFVEKLDLTGYFMSLPDLVTLGDFLAVVPVKELILENCGLTDEGVRVVLAGLLVSRKPNTRPRKSCTKPSDLVQQGGVVERVVLKNNKLGVDGWKHICLFIHMCRTVKYLDVSSISFPAPCEPAKTPLSHLHIAHAHSPPLQLDLSLILSKALGDRLAGSELELLNLGETGLTTNQLSAVLDGCLKSGVSRLGLAGNDIDAQGIQHVARYLRGGNCQGIDLGGNDLRDHLETIASAIKDDDTLWALGLANSNINPSALSKLFPHLIKLKNFKFLDLSHNHDLCESEPSAIGLLRRYLPKLDFLKRLHLADIAMSSEQAIALAEILPEISTLAHINLLENSKLVKLADAKTEESQEEACALYASLMAAVRVSATLVKIDIDNPSAESGEIVKALANQVLAYCLRNMRNAPDIRDSTSGELALEKLRYPDVLRHIVGHEEDSPIVEFDEDDVGAPDEDYVIGGTGVVKALACCLNNMGDDARRQSGEFLRDFEAGTATPRANVPAGKAKDMSKHLLASARKIRVRLQPALAQAKASSKEDMNNYNRLVFLNQTIEGIINRFEDEFPETRQNIAPVMAPSYAPPPVPELSTSLSSTEAEPVVISDNEDVDLETELRSPSRSRSNSIMSHSSKALAEEEGRALRVGHKFRRGFLRAHYDLFMNSEEIGNDPDHVRQIQNMLEELGTEDEDVRKKVEEKGAVAVFQEDKTEIMRKLREKDPEYWDRFIESQEKARANVEVGTKEEASKVNIADESAISD